MINRKAQVAWLFQGNTYCTKITCLKKEFLKVQGQKANARLIQGFQRCPFEIYLLI